MARSVCYVRGNARVLTKGGAVEAHKLVVNFLQWVSLLCYVKISDLHLGGPVYYIMYAMVVKGALPPLRWCPKFEIGASPLGHNCNQSNQIESKLVAPITKVSFLVTGAGGTFCYQRGQKHGPNKYVHTNPCSLLTPHGNLWTQSKNLGQEDVVPAHSNWFCNGTTLSFVSWRQKARVLMKVSRDYWGHANHKYWYEDFAGEMLIRVYWPQGWEPTTL